MKHHIGTWSGCLATDAEVMLSYYQGKLAAQGRAPLLKELNVHC